MSTYVVASDNIDGKEQSYIQTCISKLEAKGHTCENAGVGPNTIQSKGLSSSSSGKIGVFIVGGSDAGMYTDFVAGLKNGYYHYKHMWVVFASNTATTDKWLTCKGLESTPLVRAWDDNYSGSNIAAVGQTAKAYFDANKQYISYVCGKLGCSFDSIAEKLANGGGTDSEGETSSSTIKEAIKDILKMRDGEIECRVVNDTVYIRKIPSPETASLSLIEGIDIIQNSINITDINPDTVNVLTVHWPGGDDIVLRDEELIDRFGEKPQELDAVKRVVSTETKESTTSSSSDSTDSSDTSSIDTTTTSSETETNIEEVPVETYEEALSFANTEWAKIRRDNGHSIECKVNGSPLWQQGQWVRVFIPSFGEDGYMYITKCSHDDSYSGWTTNLTLKDYPPGFGEEEKIENDEEGEEEGETSETTEETT